MGDTEMFRKSGFNYNSVLISIVGVLITIVGFIASGVYSKVEQTHDALIKLEATSVTQRELDQATSEIHTRLDRIEQELKLKPNK